MSNSPIIRRLFNSPDTHILSIRLIQVVTALSEYVYTDSYPTARFFILTLPNYHSVIVYSLYHLERLIIQYEFKVVQKSHYLIKREIKVQTKLTIK